MSQKRGADRMYTLAAIQHLLQDVNKAVVARYTGLSRQVVHGVITGRRANPNYRVVKKLSDYVEVARVTPALQLERDRL